MAKKQQTQKRRVAAAHQAERQRAAAAKADRRRRLLVGGVVGFLALALIAPLTAGLIVNNDDPAPAPTTSAPTTTTTLVWVAPEQAGATLAGPTPCPPTDGTAERTTGFATPPPVCIEAGATYDLEFDSAAGSFTMPVDSTIDEDLANLAAVFGWYRTYEQTQITTVASGLLWVGGPGDVGFTLPTEPTDVPIEDRYPVGSVLALPGVEGGATGALLVVLDDAGADAIRFDPNFVTVGMIDDLSDLEAVAEAAAPEAELVIDAVTVTQQG